MFDNKEDVPLGVPKLVIETHLKYSRSYHPSFSCLHTNTPTDFSSSPSSSSSSSSSSTSTHTPYTPLVVMAFRPIVQDSYAALVLPTNLGNFLDGYLKHLPRFNGETGPLAEDHVSAFLDFAENMNIEEENVYMRLFVQTFGGEVRKWFREFPVGTINTLAVLHRLFLDHWEVKKNPLQILSKYENIKRNVGESVQDYCVRFNTVYNAILADIKPPIGLALIKFLYSFDLDMAYQLRERNPATLEDMQ